MSIQVADIRVDCSGCKAPGRVDEVHVAGLTTGQIYDYVEPRIVAQGWAVKIGRHGGRELLCPTCVKGEQEKITAPLPPFTPKARCPKCGSAKIATKYWTGRETVAPLGVPREHMGRTCGDCGFVWVQACADVKK